MRGSQLNFLQTLIDIALVDGTLSLSSLKNSPLTMLSFEPHQLKVHLSLILSACELQMLADCIQKSQHFLASSQPTNAVAHLGWCAPRPLAARLVSIHYQDRRKVLLVSFYQNNRVFDAILNEGQQKILLDAVQERLAHMPQRPAQHGQLEPDQGLTLDDGQRPDRLEGLTYMWGPYGEFFQPSEIYCSIAVEADCIEIDGQLFAIRVQTVRPERLCKPMPNEKPDFVNFCRLGTQADDLLIGGAFQSAEAARSKLLSQMKGSGQVDTYLLAKMSLARLLGQVLSSDFGPAIREMAHKTQAEGLEELGLLMLARGQVDYIDFLLYSELEATLYSIEPQLAQADEQDPLEAINSAMSDLFEMASEKQDPWLAALSLRNWRLHLSNLFGGNDIPQGAQRLWQETKNRFPYEVHPKILCYRWPQAWFTEQDVILKIGPESAAQPPATAAPSTPAAAAQTSGTSWWKKLMGR